MEPLALSQIIASSMLRKDCGSLQAMFDPILHFQRWQQAPVAKLMMEFSELVGQMAQACLLLFFALWESGYALL